MFSLVLPADDVDATIKKKNMFANTKLSFTMFIPTSLNIEQENLLLW